jgi:hypothetical protein
MANPKISQGPHRPEEVCPVLAQYPVVWGLYVSDGCISAEDPLEWRDVDAHAHVEADDEWRGWICIADGRSVITEKGNPTHLLWHEVAHLVCGDISHGAKWKKVMRDFGASREAVKYNRKKKETEDDKTNGLPVKMAFSSSSAGGAVDSCRRDNLAERDRFLRSRAWSDGNSFNR